MMGLRGASWLDALGSWVRRQPGPQHEVSAWHERCTAYARADSYYANTVYQRTSDGGQREAINRSLGNARAEDLDGLYNPVAQVVDLYQHVFGSPFAVDALDTGPDRIQIRPGRQAAPTLTEAICQLWQWSNLTIERQPLCRFAALYGTCGLRIVADMAHQRVYLKVEHPQIIRDVELDDRGNVRGIELEWQEQLGLGDTRETLTIREVLTREAFHTYRVDGAALIPYDRATRQDYGPGAVAPNVLGLVPYVVVRHGYTGDVFGMNACDRALVALDRYNALMSHIDVQIHQHVKATWLVMASGKPPQEFDLSGRKVLYVDTSTALQGASTPVVQALVANLSLADATQQAKAQLEAIEDMLPELKAVSGRWLSNTSGQTIAELRKPAEDALLLARTNYEDALIRAQQIAISYGVLLGLWDMGTGMGTVEAADRAYHEGTEDHTFVPRPALTETSRPATTLQSPHATPTPPLPSREEDSTYAMS